MAKKQKGDNVSQATAESFVSHEDDPMITFSEAGALIGRSHTTIRNWVRDGLLRAFRDPSGLRRIRRSELTRFYSGTALAETRPLSGDVL